MKAKDKERRLKLREEKIEQQRLHQEERVRKALERAKAEPKKQVSITTIQGKDRGPSHRAKSEGQVIGQSHRVKL